jgi:GNAT superfamily N-acetyltransferase
MLWPKPSPEARSCFARIFVSLLQSVSMFQMTIKTWHLSSEDAKLAFRTYMERNMDAIPQTHMSYMQDIIPKAHQLFALSLTTDAESMGVEAVAILVLGEVAGDSSPSYPVLYLHTHPDHRGRRHSSALLSAAKAWCPMGVSLNVDKKCPVMNFLCVVLLCRNAFYPGDKLRETEVKKSDECARYDVPFRWKQLHTEEQEVEYGLCVGAISAVSKAQYRSAKCKEFAGAMMLVLGSLMAGLPKEQDSVTDELINLRNGGETPGAPVNILARIAASARERGLGCDTVTGW